MDPFPQIPLCLAPRLFDENTARAAGQVSKTLRALSSHVNTVTFMFKEDYTAANAVGTVTWKAEFDTACARYCPSCKLVLDANSNNAVPPMLWANNNHAWCARVVCLSLAGISLRPGDGAQLAGVLRRCLAIEQIDLRGLDYHTNDFRPIEQAMSSLPKLASLDMASVQHRHNTPVMQEDVLRLFTNLTHLDMSDNFRNEQQAANPLNALVHCTNMTRLVWRDNSLDDRGLIMMGTALQAMRHLVTVFIEVDVLVRGPHTQLHTDAMEAMLAGLQVSTRLESLNLAGSFTAPQLRILAARMPRFPNLCEVAIKCPAADDVLYAAILVHCRKVKKVAGFETLYNRGDLDSVLQKLGAVVDIPRPLHSLEYLHVRFEQAHNEPGVRLADFIAYLPNLRRVELQDMGVCIALGVVSEWMAALQQHCPLLDDVYIHGYAWPVEIFTAVLQSLQQIGSLKHFECHLAPYVSTSSAAYVPVLCALLRNNQSLESCTFGTDSHDQFPDDCARQLAAAAWSNANLKTLQVYAGSFSPAGNNILQGTYTAMQQRQGERLEYDAVVCAE